MTHHQCLIVLNQVCFLLFHLQGKPIISHDEIRNLIPDELHLFDQKDKIEDIDNIQHKLRPADSNNISFIRHKCFENLIIQSTDLFVQSTTPKYLLQINTNL